MTCSLYVINLNIFLFAIKWLCLMPNIYLKLSDFYESFPYRISKKLDVLNTTNCHTGCSIKFFRLKCLFLRRACWFRVTDDGVQTRAHLEVQLASAQALQSPIEYRQCLLSYIRFLARFVVLMFFLQLFVV